MTPIDEKCLDTYFRYSLNFQSGYYDIVLARPNGSVWFHIAFNFIGLNDDQGIIIYHNGVMAGNLSTQTETRQLIGLGPMALGVIEFNDCVGSIFSSMQVDELLFFDHYLTADEISILSQSST